MTMKHFRRGRMLGAVLTAGTLCQFGSCDLGQITATSTVTLDGREVIINMIRGAIITPLDALITDAVNNAFDGD